MTARTKKTENTGTNKRNGGFTLLEIVAVLVIIAILAAIAIPSFSAYQKKNRERAAETECMAAVAWANTLSSELYARGAVDGVSKADVLGKVVRSETFLSEVLQKAGLTGRIGTLVVSGDAQVTELRYFLAGDAAEFWYGAVNTYTPSQALGALVDAVSAAKAKNPGKTWTNSYTDSGAVGFNANAGTGVLQGRSDSVHECMVEAGVNLTNCTWTVQQFASAGDFWLYYFPQEAGVEYKAGDKVTAYVYRSSNGKYYTSEAKLEKNSNGYLQLRLTQSSDKWKEYNG